MTLLLDPAYPEQLDRVSKIFKLGHPVALPTETVYGLAAPLDNPIAIARIFKLKNRPEFHPLIVHVLDWGMTKPLITKVNSLEQILVRNFWPGPLSIVFPKTTLVPDLVTGGRDSVVLRCPEHIIMRTILSRLNKPLVAPSANRFQGISPTDTESVLKELGPYGLEGVVDGGECIHGIESTIVRVENENTVSILRAGSVSQERLKEVLPPDTLIQMLAEEGMPGAHARHYAPKKSLYLIGKEKDLQNIPNFNPQKCVLLKVFPSDGKWLNPEEFQSQIVLSTRESDVEASAQLFRVLRRLDENPNVKTIIACKTTKKGLGVAINDRLQRASFQ